jgi:hypothetical protein
VEHPHHTLPVILALANSYRDEEVTGGTQKERKSEVCHISLNIAVKKKIIYIYIYIYIFFFFNPHNRLPVVHMYSLCYIYLFY